MTFRLKVYTTPSSEADLHQDITAYIETGERECVEFKSLQTVPNVLVDEIISEIEAEFYEHMRELKAFMGGFGNE